MAKGTLNRVTILGRLGREPEIKITAGGLSIAKLSIATTESSGSKANDTYNEYTEWHKVTLFGKAAEIAGQYLAKGSRVAIEGKLQTTKWEDKNGIERYTTEIMGNQLHLIDPKKTTDNSAYDETTDQPSEFDDSDIPF